MINAMPFTFTSTSNTSSSNAVKSATPDIIMFNDDQLTADSSIMVDLLFEDIGGQELLTISRHDTVNGQNVLYQPIKNLNILKDEYNPNNIIMLQKTSDKIFKNFSIKLEESIPEVGNGPSGSNVYLDVDGNLVIEFINMIHDEQVDVQITSGGILYEAGI